MCPLYKNLSFKIEFFSPFSNLCFCIWPTLIFYIPCSNIRYSSKIVTVISISHTQTPDPSQEYKKEKISLLEGKGREGTPKASTVQPYSSCTISGSVFFMLSERAGNKWLWGPPGTRAFSSYVILSRPSLLLN